MTQLARRPMRATRPQSPARSRLLAGGAGRGAPSPCTQGLSPASPIACRSATRPFAVRRVSGWSSPSTRRELIRVSWSSSRAASYSPSSLRSMARLHAEARVLGWSSPSTRRRRAGVSWSSSRAAGSGHEQGSAHSVRRWLPSARPGMHVQRPRTHLHAYDLHPLERHRTCRQLRVAPEGAPLRYGPSGGDSARGRCCISRPQRTPDRRARAAASGAHSAARQHAEELRARSPGVREQAAQGVEQAEARQVGEAGRPASGLPAT
jgi:hypothetical protein